jgi:cysteine dioxygenase
VTSVPKLFPIKQLVEGLRRFPEDAFRTTESVRAFLAETPVDPASLAPYMTWDRQHYTRNLIDKTKAYELIAICWETGQGSSVHNHQDQNCWMAVPIGRLKVQNYKVIHEDISAGTCELAPTDHLILDVAHPCAVNPLEPVHGVENAKEFNQRAVSLHVYSFPFNTCVVYSLEKKTCGVIELHYNTEYGLKTNLPA